MQTQRDDVLDGLDAALEQGLADLAAGRSRPAEEVFDGLEAKYGAFARAKRRT